MTFAGAASGFEGDVGSVSSVAGGGGSPAVVAATVAGLGAGSAGKLGWIRIGAFPDTEYVELIYDEIATKWIGKPHALMGQSDQAYMGVNTNAFSYVGTNSAGGSTGAIGWTTRPIRRAAQLLAAGLKLQAVFSAVIAGTTTPATFTVQPHFFQNDDLDVISTSADGSTAAAIAAALVSPNSNAFTYKSTGWQDILKYATANPLAAADVTKKYLWPRLYGKTSAGALYGQIIDADIQYRWVA